MAVSDDTRTSGDADSGVEVQDVKQEVVTGCSALPRSDDSLGGVVCTGFIDVEKLITIRGHHPDDGATGGDRGHDHHHKKVLLLEKKLPFQILILRLV